jgi:hypothetical protein
MPLANVTLPDAFFSRRALGTTSGRLTADDVVEIMDVVARFEWSFDARRFDALADLLTEDVVCDHIFGYRAGKTAVMDMLTNVIPYYGLRHQSTNATVYLDERGSPCAVSYLVVIQVATESGDDGPFPLVIADALVTDSMRRENGRWRIAGRTFEQMKVTSVYLPDEATRRSFEATAAERAARTGAGAQGRN